MFATTALLPACTAAEPSAAALVHRDVGCGCCHGWMVQMQRTGRFRTELRDEADMAALKRRLGVPGDLASCHTTEVAGFVIEGHVPPADVLRLLRERPAGAIGLATPGMPLGSPGMEQASGARDAYEVMSFHRDGSRAVFSRYEARVSG
jgi:hypothetical protein